MGKHIKAFLVIVGVVVVLAAVPAIAGAASGTSAAAPSLDAPGALAAGPVFGWVTQLRGAARSEDLTYDRFRYLATHGQGVTWTDNGGTPEDPSDDHEYMGLPLWRLVARIDDLKPGSFNDTLAAKDYAIEVIGVDGFTAPFTSTQIARNNDILVAELMDGAPLILGEPKLNDDNTFASWKPSWPLKIVGPNLSGKQRPGAVERIVVYKPGVTPPTTPSTVPFGWLTQLRGAKSEELLYTRFGYLVTHGQGVTWTDDGGTPGDPSDDHKYKGLPLWRLVGRVDDGSAGTFNDNLAGMDYGLTVMAVDGFNATFTAMEMEHNNDVLVAYRMDGKPLILGEPKLNDDNTFKSWRPSWPLKIVGPNLTGMQRPGAVERIVLDKPVYPDYKTSLTLRGVLTKTIPYATFPNGVAWDGTKAGDINPTLKAVYRGQTLYKLIGRVDDRDPKTFNATKARKHYKIRFICRDGYKVTIDSATIIDKKGWIVACLKDDRMLSAEEGPYRYVGSFIKPFFGKLSASQVVEIRLLF